MAKLGKYTKGKAPMCADGSQSAGGGEAPLPAPRKRPMPGKSTFTRVSESSQPNIMSTGKYGKKS